MTNVIIFILFIIILIFLVNAEASKSGNNNETKSNIEIKELYKDINKIIKWHQERNLSIEMIKEIKYPKKMVFEKKVRVFQTIPEDERSIEDRMSALVIRRLEAVKSKQKIKLMPRNYYSSYSDPRWLDLRKRILLRDGFKCQVCSKILGGLAKETQIHHLFYNGEVWDVPEETLITLCYLCHEETHNNKYHILYPF